jgi:hypothetical protein
MSRSGQFEAEIAGVACGSKKGLSGVTLRADQAP